MLFFTSKKHLLNENNFDTNVQRHLLNENNFDTNEQGFERKITLFCAICTSQTMHINSLVIARQNMPITLIHTETTLS